ncbi:MAG: amidohydrolase family protein [Pseudomonadota bacterium]
MSTRIENVSILDGTGADPFAGAVLIEGDSITKVEKNGNSSTLTAETVIDGQGMTLMPGLIDAHLHLSWSNQATLEEIALMPPEEHTLVCAQSAKTVLDMGFTSGVGAAAAKPRLDVVMKNAIAAGDIPGPRYLAASQEIATKGGLGDTSPVHIDIQDLSFGWVISGPEEMRAAVRMFFKYGVDIIKINLSGEYIAGVDAEEEVISEEELAAGAAEVHRRKRMMAAHARSAKSVQLCLQYGIRHIYHASFIDEETIDMLERSNEEFFVAPGLAWLIQTARGAQDWGILPGSPLAEQYEQELACAIEGMKELYRRGIPVLPGGDYGFAWTPHGTNAKDLQYFVEMLGMSPMDAIVSATKHGGRIMRMGDRLGTVTPGYLADLLLVDGDPLADISVLQEQSKLAMIMKDGRTHRLTVH